MTSPIPRPATPPPDAPQPAAAQLPHPAPSPGPSPLAKRPKPTDLPIDVPATTLPFDPTKAPAPLAPLDPTDSIDPLNPLHAAPPSSSTGIELPPLASIPAMTSQPPPPIPATPVATLDQAPPLLVKKLHEKASAPTRGSAFAAGYDLYAAEDTVVPARGKALVGTGLAVGVPGGTYGRIAPRSGLAVKKFIDTGAGVIDADYRGEVKVLLFNHSEEDFGVKVGERVAQMVLERIYTPDVVVVEELEESVRGAGGFGSTG